MDGEGRVLVLGSLGGLSVYVADERFEVEMKEKRSEREKRRIVGSLSVFCIVSF